MEDRSEMETDNDSGIPKKESDVPYTERKEILSDTSQSTLGLPQTDPKSIEELEWEQNIRETPEFNELLQSNLDDNVIFEIFKLVERGIIELTDIDETVREAVCRFTKVQGAQFFKVLGNKDLSHIARKAPYICAQTKIFSYYIKNKLTIFNGPDKVKIAQLKHQTGYPIQVTEGQRRFGPPPDWEGEAPQHREISVSKIPADWYEDKLVPIFSKFGKIYELRIMIDNVTGLTRHFCFVRYCEAEETEAAIFKLDEYVLDDGQTLKANFSSGNKKLFVGNIPKTETADSLKLLFGPHVHVNLSPINEESNYCFGTAFGFFFFTGLHNVEVCVSEEMVAKGLKNRGFCFIEFHSHSYSAEGKKVITGLGPKLFDGKVLRVDWADKQYEPTPAECAKVKCMHVSNIASSVTEEKLRLKFEYYGKLFHVQKVRDYAFIHYEERADCLQAIQEADGTELEGLRVGCRLSRSGPMMRKIKRQNEKAKLRGEFGFGKKKERPQPPTPKRHYSNNGSSRNFHSGNREGRFGNSGYGGYRCWDGPNVNQGYHGGRGGYPSGQKRRYDNNSSYPGSNKRRRY